MAAPQPFTRTSCRGFDPADDRSFAIRLLSSFHVFCLCVSGAILLPAALLLLVGGCKDEDPDSLRVPSSQTGTIQGIDVRGGDVDSTITTGTRGPYEGDGGKGGAFKATTVGAVTGSNELTVTSAPPGPVAPLDAAVSFPAPTLSGLPYLDVVPGQTVSASGLYEYEWVRVQAGGILQLVGNTVFLVYGDVLIAGSVIAKVDRHAIHAQDFTLVASGVIHVTGLIDCSGFWQRGRPATDPNGLPGGDGGEVYVQANALTGNPGIYVSPGAAVLAEGGPTWSYDGAGARPGRGGQVLLGTGSLGATQSSDIVMAGRISARGGNAVYAAAGFEGDGGVVELTATGSIRLNSVLEINARGGSSSGATAGDGGEIMLSAPAGVVDLRGVNLVCDGGPATYRSSSVGGIGGKVTVAAAAVTLSGTVIGASGGSAYEVDDGPIESSDTGGKGGAGGTVGIAATETTLNAGQLLDAGGANTLIPIQIYAMGGTTIRDGDEGGEGGQIVMSNSSGNPANFTFAGYTSVSGGLGDKGLSGKEGEVCTSGASQLVALQVSGMNNFPPSLCSAEDLGTVSAASTLSCDESSGLPETIQATVPVVVGVNIFKVAITAATEAYVIVETKGTIDGLLHLYVGPASVLGSLDTTMYPFRDETAGETKKVCVPLGDARVDGDPFLSVLVVEKNNFVEDYEITVSCSGAPCTP